jgi:hypothetical protein
MSQFQLKEQKKERKKGRNLKLYPEYFDKMNKNLLRTFIEKKIERQLKKIEKSRIYFN